MARFDPPQKFSFIADEWKDWISEYSRYRRAVKLYADDGEDQRDQLLYAMGVKEAEKIYKTFQFKKITRTKDDGTEEEIQEKDTDFDCLVSKFTEHFVPLVNIRYERRKFNERVQHEDETVESFVRSLHSLASTCKYTDEDDMILDRLIAGIKNTHIREKLQMDTSIDLAKAVRIARQHELIRGQESKATSAAQVQEVKYKKYEKGKPKYSGPKKGKPPGKPSHHPSPNASGSAQSSSQGCERCGTQHGEERCPAKGRICGYCKKRGHFIAVCRKKKLKEGRGASEVEANECFYIGAVSSPVLCPDGGPAWQTELFLCGKKVNFKIDTGADVSVVSQETFNSLPQSPSLCKTRTKLTSPGGQLKTLGEFQAVSIVKNTQYKFRVVVVDHLRNNLLGRSVSQKMGLVARLEESEEIFGRSGVMSTEPVKIELKPDAVPYSVTTCRRIPFPLLDKVKTELDRMEGVGIIGKVTEPTDWCAPMVPVVKKNGDIRVCADFKKLNQCVKRPHLMLPNLEDIAPKLAGATVFSTLDISSGFYQVPLSAESRHLTTFMTPAGRYYFRRLPMGINIGPEEFQRKMVETFGGLEGCECIMDDLLVYGKTKEEHDRRLDRVTEVAKQIGVKFNKNKCHIRKNQVDYFGHRIGASGIYPSQEKIEALARLSPPSNVTELRSLLGMLNFQSKFVANLATVAKPMSDLLKSDVMWQWGPDQQQSLERVKERVIAPPALAFYRSDYHTIVSADASSYGLGGVLLQRDNAGNTRPVAYCSRTLTESEKKYAQIEKEGLASTWACEKFYKYLVGLPSFELWTDHKPLVPLLTTKDLDQAPIRCQRLLLRMMRFNPVVKHVPGKNLVIADALSRNPIPHTKSHEAEEKEVVYAAESVQVLWPVSKHRLQDIRNATASDPVLLKVQQLILEGFPRNSRTLSEEMRPYAQEQVHLSIAEGIVTYGDRIVIPQTLRQEMLVKLHETHQGISKCREKAKSCIWWPGISKDIGHFVDNCMTCRMNRPAQRHEPLLPTELPCRVWSTVSADLCEVNKKYYLVVVDAYSRWLEVKSVPSLTTKSVISRMKDIIATHGVMDELLSDNGTQFMSEEFKQFAKNYGFAQITSSPLFAQANGEAESGVKIAKKILAQEDPHLALLNYRSTPHSATGVSPAEALMSRRLQTRLPVLAKKLLPLQQDHEAIRKSDNQAKASYKVSYDRHHGARNLPEIPIGKSVLIKSPVRPGWTLSGTVSKADTEHRTYLVHTPAGDFRRNRQQLQPVPEPPERNAVYPDTPVIPSPDVVESPLGDFGTKSSEDACTPVPVLRRSGRAVVKPRRLVEES